VENLTGLTTQEGEVIRAVATLNNWRDVCGIGREVLGRELTKQEAWVTGRRASSLWKQETGLAHPSYALMPKRFSGSEPRAHLKAVYPPSWVDRIGNLIKIVANQNSVANDFQEHSIEGEIPIEDCPIYIMFGPET
jgi:hypothetical protein